LRRCWLEQLLVCKIDWLGKISCMAIMAICCDVMTSSYFIEFWLMSYLLQWGKSLILQQIYLFYLIIAEIFCIKTIFLILLRLLLVWNILLTFYEIWIIFLIFNVVTASTLKSWFLFSIKVKFHHVLVWRIENKLVMLLWFWFFIRIW
jgi:hypothetical protein